MLIDHKNIDLDFPSALDRMESMEFSPDELSVVDRVFATATLEGHDILPGSEAVKVFEGSGLEHDVLRDIWHISNVENKGTYLTRNGVAIAVRLMGWAQNGTPPSKSLIESQGPLVTFENLQPASSSPFAPSADLSMAPRAEDIEKYTRIFNSCTLTPEGLVEGDSVNNLFLRSRLPATELYAVWDISDSKSRGHLDLNEFCIAMHLIRLLMEHKIPSVPSSLPPELSRLLHSTDLQEEPGPPLPPKPPEISIEVPELPSYSQGSSRSEPRPATKPPRPPPKPRRPPPQPPLSASIPHYATLPRSGIRPDSMRGRSISEAGSVVGSTHQRSVSSYESSPRSRSRDVSPRRSADSVTMRNRPVTSYEGLSPDSISSTLSPPPQSVSRRARSVSPSPALSSASPVLPSPSMPSPNTLAPPRLPRPSSAVPSSPSPSTSSHVSSSPILPLLSPSSPQVIDGLPINDEWVITEADSVMAEHYFSKLDPAKRGWLRKDVVGSVLIQSELSDEDLQAIWELVDIDCNGRLSKDACISMMALVRMRIAGHELPSTLPASLQPSSTASNISGPSGSSFPPFNDSSRMSFWMPSSIPADQETITNLQSKIDAMNERIEELVNMASESSILSPLPSSAPTERSAGTASTSSIDLASPPLPTRRDKGKGRMVQSDIEEAVEDQEDDEEDRPLSSFISRRKSSIPLISGALSSKFIRTPPSTKENEKLRKRIDDLVRSLSDQERVNDALKKDRSEMKDQIAALQQQGSSSLKKNRGNERLKKQIDQLKEELGQWKTKTKHASAQAAASFTEERKTMDDRIKGVEEGVIRVLVAGGDRDLGRMVAEARRKNSQFRMSLHEIEEHVNQVRFQGGDIPSSINERIHADLTKENEQLRKRMEEMEEMLVVLQSQASASSSSSRGLPDADLQMLVEDLTRENERMRTKVTETRTMGDELAQVRSRQSELERENEQLRREAGEARERADRADRATRRRGREENSAVPPPAYHEIDQVARA